MRNDQTNKKSGGIPPVLLIALTFIALICIGTTLLMLPISNRSGNVFPFVDALFTATSAVCVTGLAVVDTYTNFTFVGQLVILILIQCGGLGLMTIATLMFIYVGKKITLKDRLVLQEAYSDNKLTGLLKTTQKIIKVTLIIELIGAILLSMYFIPRYGYVEGMWKSVFHAISAFCNAGFDILGGGTSLTTLSSETYLLLVISLLVIVGGLGFSVLFDIDRVAKKKSNHFQTHSAIVLMITAVLLLLGTIGFFILEYNNPLTLGKMSLPDKIVNSFVQSVMPRTAGFSSLNQGGLSHLAQTLTTILMFIGASPASTGGGVKTTTFLILIMVFVAGSTGRNEVLIKGKRVPQNTCYKAIAIVFLAIIIIVVVSSVVFAIEMGAGNMWTMQEVYFETVSAFGTVGLSTGITSQLTNASLIIIACVMFVGRLGMLCLSLIFLMGGSNKKIHLNIRHADAKIVIG